MKTMVAVAEEEKVAPAPTGVGSLLPFPLRNITEDDQVFLPFIIQQLINSVTNTAIGTVSWIMR